MGARVCERARGSPSSYASQLVGHNARSFAFFYLPLPFHQVFARKDAGGRSLVRSVVVVVLARDQNGAANKGENPHHSPRTTVSLKDEGGPSVVAGSMREREEDSRRVIIASFDASERAAPTEEEGKAANEGRAEHFLLSSQRWPMDPPRRPRPLLLLPIFEPLSRWLNNL